MIIAWFWTFYFVLKVGLYFKGAVNIHFWPNLALLILAMPFSPPRGRLKRSMILRQFIAVPLGFSIFWYDSYLPPFFYSLQFLRPECAISFSKDNTAWLSSAKAGG